MVTLRQPLGHERRGTARGQEGRIELWGPFRRGDCGTELSKALGGLAWPGLGKADRLHGQLGLLLGVR